MRTTLPVIAVSLLTLAGCQTRFGDGPDVVFVTDLSKVAGCRFLGPVRSPTVALGSRRSEGYDLYGDELKRIAAARGATHLYVLNRSASWGGALALATAYFCDP